MTDASGLALVGQGLKQMFGGAAATVTDKNKDHTVKGNEFLRFMGTGKDELLIKLRDEYPLVSFVSMIAAFIFGWNVFTLSPFVLIPSIIWLAYTYCMAKCIWNGGTGYFANVYHSAIEFFNSRQTATDSTEDSA